MVVTNRLYDDAETVARAMFENDTNWPEIYCAAAKSYDTRTALDKEIGRRVVSKRGIDEAFIPVIGQALIFAIKRKQRSEMSKMGTREGCVDNNKAGIFAQIGEMAGESGLKFMYGSGPQEKAPEGAGLERATKTKIDGDLDDYFARCG